MNFVKHWTLTIFVYCVWYALVSKTYHLWRLYFQFYLCIIGELFFSMHKKTAIFFHHYIKYYLKWSSILLFWRLMINTKINCVYIFICIFHPSFLVTGIPLLFLGGGIKWLKFCNEMNKLIFNQNHLVKC